MRAEKEVEAAAQTATGSSVEVAPRQTGQTCGHGSLRAHERHRKCPHSMAAASTSVSRQTGHSMPSAGLWAISSI